MGKTALAWQIPVQKMSERKRAEKEMPEQFLVQKMAAGKMLGRGPAKEEINENREKMEAFARLEASRKASGRSLDYDKEREEAMNAKYGGID